MVDDLHRVARVDAGEVGQDDEGERRLVVERAEDIRDVAHADAHLGLVVALLRRTMEDALESRVDAARERSIHRVQTPAGTVGPIARSGQCPRRSLMSCWSFIIPKIRPSGRGGQPGTYTSTGMIRSMPSTVE